MCAAAARVTRRRGGFVPLLLALGALASAACATRTGIARTDVVAQPAEPFRKALVLGMDAQGGMREQLERAIVEALARRGAEVVAASSFIDLSLGPPSRDDVRGLVEREGFDAVVVAQIEPRGTDSQPVPSTSMGFPLSRQPLGFYDHFGRSWPYGYAPAYRETVALGALDVRLFETARDGRLVFRASSEQFELRDAPRAVATVSDLVAERLVRAALLAAPRVDPAR